MLSIDWSKFLISGSTCPFLNPNFLKLSSKLTSGFSSTAFLKIFNVSNILFNFGLSFFVISLFISVAFLPANLFRYFSKVLRVPLKVAPKVLPKPKAIKYSLMVGNSFSSINSLIVISVPDKVPPKIADCLIPFQPFNVEPKGIACTIAAAKASP